MNHKRQAILVLYALAPLLNPPPSLSQVELPLPTGPHAVGTLVQHLVDESRANPGSPDNEPAGRDLMIQCWYPANPGPEEIRAMYALDTRIVEAMLEAEYYEQSVDVLKSMYDIRTHSYHDAPLAKIDDPLSVLILSHGLGVARILYTTLAEELASHGYMVVAVDHPAGGFTVLPDGHLLSTAHDPALREESGFGLRVEDWARDAIFIIDTLPDLEPASIFSNHLDLKRVGMLGHSMGGLAALRACCLDDRFVAASNLDGAPLGTIQETGTCKPALILRSGPDYSDADLAKRGRTREQWDEMGSVYKQMWAEWLAKSKAIVHCASILGSGHLSFSDSPWVMPDTITRFGGRIIDAQRCRDITMTAVRAFFDEHLRGRATRTLDELDQRYPEVTMTITNP